MIDYTMKSPILSTSIEGILHDAGIDTRYIHVTVDPRTKSIIITRGEIPMSIRVHYAKKVLRNVDLDTMFYTNGALTSCVIPIDRERVSIGTSYCSFRDTYDENIGKAIAYERAKFGKVKTTELLG